MGNPHLSRRVSLDLHHRFAQARAETKIGMHFQQMPNAEGFIGHSRAATFAVEAQQDPQLRCLHNIVANESSFIKNTCE